LAVKILKFASILSGRIKRRFLRQWASHSSMRYTTIHLFCTFGGVGGCWLAEKWLGPQITTEILVFWLLDPSHKKVSTVLSSLQK